MVSVNKGNPFWKKGLNKKRTFLKKVQSKNNLYKHYDILLNKLEVKNG